jgi:serine/threonine protein kinase
MGSLSVGSSSSEGEPATSPARAAAAAVWDPRTLLEIEPARFLRRVPGRETFDWPPAVGAEEVGLGEVRMIVKRSRGGDVRERWRERLSGRTPRSPGRREFENLAALAAEGFPVPRALGWCERGVRSAVAMELVPHAETLRERLGRSEPGEVRHLAALLLELVARLHEKGWYHRDLYLEHVLVRADGAGAARAGGAPRAAPEGRELVLIDVGRARRVAVRPRAEDSPEEPRAEGARGPRRRWLVKDLAALLHSTPAAVPPRARLRFLAGYLDRRGVRGRARRRAWARAVLAKQARMARHRPRHGAGGSDARGGA